VNAHIEQFRVISDIIWVYGLDAQVDVGYRQDVTDGVPTGSQPQGAYMATSGTHVDNLCCFDFGNAETSNTDTGKGHMDAINFGTLCWFQPCAGTGPWVTADLENGLFSGGNGSDPGNSSGLVTAMLKNNGTASGHYIITNANSGTVLDSVNCGSFDGTLTDLWSPLGNNCQEWDVTPVGGHYTISNVANGMVLDAEDCETANGTVVRQWAQPDNACQQWDISK
jgi:hypothetical protein